MISKRILQIIWGLLIIGAFLLPFKAGPFTIRFLTDIMIFAILASAWNIIGGYTGYASFGNVVFFGIGAYATAVSMAKFAIPFWGGLVVSALLAATFAMLMGLPILRLKGHYFAIATLGVAEAMKALVKNLEITDGNVGIVLPISRSVNLFYFCALGTLLLTALTVYLVTKSRLGYGLVAIREDEDAANAVGVNTTLFKSIAFTLSGFFSGIAGGIHAYQSTFIEPDPVFDVVITVKIIVMSVFGGIGSIAGPIIGAFSIEYITEYLSHHFLVAHALFFGVIVILAIIFMPRGVWDIISGRRKFGIAYFLENIRKYRV